MKMDFLKPTKVKIVVMVFIYLLNISKSLVETVFILLMAPKSIVGDLLQFSTEVKGIIKLSPSTALAIPVMAFFIEIIFLYLTSCIVVHFLKSQNRKDS